MSDAVYIPHFLYAALPLPPDTRTPAERECDRFCWFAQDLGSYGPEDAREFARTENNKDLSQHPPDCASCKERFRRGKVEPISDEQINILLARAATLLRSLEPT